MTIFVAAACMVLTASRYREWRGGLMLLACLFLAVAMHELGEVFRPFFPFLDEPENIPVAAFIILGVLLAALNYGTTATGFKVVYSNRRFPLLVWGLLLSSVLPNMADSRTVWGYFVPSADNTRPVRELAENAVEMLGYVMMLNWAVLFLKDKWRTRRRARVSPHEHLVFEHPLVEIGHGSRRVCYRIGDTGFCAKFYKRPEDCTRDKMKPSVRRDISRRRFNKVKNSCSQEVLVWEKFRHTMPEEIRSAMPQIMERVFHPVWGWGVLETFFQNPDGRPILPVEWEMDRPGNEHLVRSAYRQMEHYLELLIAHSAPFYEASNFFAWLQPDGTVKLRIVDFEPDSKTLFPIEAVWPWFRRRKLRRDAGRYLLHWRRKYNLDSVESDAATHSDT